MVTGFKCRVLRSAIKIYIFWIALIIYRGPFAATRALKKLINERRKVQGNQLILKYVRADKRYYWSNVVPGFPSPLFRRFIENELSRKTSTNAGSGYLNTIIFSITSRCPLHCQHCFEYQNLDNKEYLSLQDLKTIQSKFQNRGISQIQLSGGEPLYRFADMIELMKSARSEIDFWLLTSGYDLDMEKALKLKKAGLTGVNISLDHWNEEFHNSFRKNSKSFYWAIQAAINSRKADIIVCFSLCATREFVSYDNLWKYVNLARECGAGFVRILEPRKVGGYADKDVDLNENQLAILKNFFLKINSNPEYGNLPILMYPGYHQRLIGCFGAGDRYLFVDSKGDIHACPFCQNKVGNALVDPIDDVIKKLREIGCHEFKMASSK